MSTIGRLKSDATVLVLAAAIGLLIGPMEWLARLQGADIVLSYTSTKGEAQEIRFVMCPEGELLHFRDFEPDSNGPQQVPAFLIGQAELSSEDYVRFVAIAERTAPDRKLPSLENLLTRVADSVHSNHTRDRASREKWEALRGLLVRRYQLPNGGKLPVLGLTFDEANELALTIQDTQNPDSQTQLVVNRVTVPTQAQWEYACRGATRVDPLDPLCHLPAWPKAEEQKEIEKSTDQPRRNLYEEINDLFDLLQTPDFDGPNDNQPIDLSSSEEFILLLRRYAEAERKVSRPDIKNPAAEGRSSVFVPCFLREVLRHTIVDASERDSMPVTCGVAPVEAVMKSSGFADGAASFEGGVELLCNVDRAGCSIPNHWGLLHMMGNVSEWARESDQIPNPLIVGSGVFDQAVNWRRCLVWFADNQKSTTPAYSAVGVRYVLQRTLTPDYLPRLAGRLRRSGNDPQYAERAAIELRRSLADIEPVVSPERFDEEIRPLVEYVLAYMESHGDRQLVRSNAGKNLSERFDVNAGETSEVSSLLHALSFVESHSDRR